VYIDDVFGDGEVGIFIAFVKDDEKQIETGHDRGGEVEIRFERFGFIISPSNGIRRSEDGGSCVEGRLDASLGNGDGLLFHGFMDGNLIPWVHFIKFVDATNTLKEGSNVNNICVWERCGGWGGCCIRCRQA